MGFLDWVEGGALATALRGSGDLYMLVNAAHILGLGLLLGAIVPLDLRLIGFFRATPLDVIAPFLSRAAAFGLGLAGLTGLSLWSVDPAEYLANTAFRVKAVLLGLAGINIFLQHRGAGWRALRARAGSTATPADASSAIPTAATRARAAVSLTLWLSILLAGRWIGFL